MDTQAAFDGRSANEKALGLVALTVPAGTQMRGMALILPSSIRTRVITELLRVGIDRQGLIAACNNHREAAWWIHRHPGDTTHLIEACKQDLEEEARQISR